MVGSFTNNFLAHTWRLKAQDWAAPSVQPLVGPRGCILAGGEAGEEQPHAEQARPWLWLGRPEHLGLSRQLTAPAQPSSWRGHCLRGLMTWHQAPLLKGPAPQHATPGPSFPLRMQMASQPRLERDACTPLADMETLTQGNDLSPRQHRNPEDAAGDRHWGCARSQPGGPRALGRLFLHLDGTFGLTLVRSEGSELKGSVLRTRNETHTRTRTRMHTHVTLM